MRGGIYIFSLGMLLSVATGVAAQGSHAQAPPLQSDSVVRFYHHPEVDYGSAGQFSPLSVALNRGFSTLVWRSAERRFLQIDWSAGLATTWDALVDPVGAIRRRGGWVDWIKTEFGPFDPDYRTWAFASNFAGHVVAGGITYRALSEWYQVHGVPAPALMGGLTVMGTILINETIEGRHGGPGHASTVADLYVFEPLGIALFSIDGVARFFAERLNAADWSPQASVTFPELRIQNVGQLMSYHVGLPGLSSVDLLVLIGQGNEFGLMWELDGGYSVAAGAGFTAASRILDRETKEHLDARLAGGLYLARNNSLLASLRVARNTYNLARLNLYPGIFQGPLRDLGGWLEINRGGEFSFGVSLHPMQGLGVGYDVLNRP